MTEFEEYMRDIRVQPRQTNCQQEPTYPGSETVVFAMVAPGMTVHGESQHCGINEPHAISVCGEWQWGISAVTARPAQ